VKEATVVTKICSWLKKQGFHPEPEKTVFRGGRKRRVDIYFKDKSGKNVGIEVKENLGGIYDGIGKAAAYLLVVDESWLAVNTGMAKRLKKLNRIVGLPFHIFDWKKKELTVGMKQPKIIERIRYICPICGETITPEKKFLNLHMKGNHGYCTEEIKDAIKALCEDRYLKARIDHYKKHSERFDY